MKVTVKDGIIQITQGSKTITASIANIVFVRDSGKNFAFYGSRGKSTFSDDEFEEIHNELGLPLPTVTIEDDDEDDLTVAPSFSTPN